MAGCCKQRAKHCVFCLFNIANDNHPTQTLGFSRPSLHRKLEGLEKKTSLGYFLFALLQMDDKASCAPVKFQPIHQSRRRLNVGQDNRRCSPLGSEVTVSCCSGHTEKTKSSTPANGLIYFLYLSINSSPSFPESTPGPGPSRPRRHSHAPLGRPALECRSWGRISLQALNMLHVSRRAAADREV